MIRTLKHWVLSLLFIFGMASTPGAIGQCAGVVIDMIVTSQTDVACNGASTGEITLDATGGTAPYTFTWAAPVSTVEDTVSNLAAGTYYITVTDALGCDTLDSVIITQPPVLDVTAGSTPATCGSADGTATAVGSGGVGPYSYTWWPLGGNAATATGLVQGDYQVTVIDANLCTDTYLVTVDAVGGPNLTLVSATGVSCNGSVDGQGTVGASGGSGMYTFTWNPGGLDGNVQTGLAAGDYSVTVQDGAGCTDNMTVTITEPAQIQLSPANVNAATCGSSDGDVGVFVSGGTGPYSYAWTPNIGSTQVVNGVSSGLYSVVVTDANGCTETTSIVVPDATGPAVSIVSSSDVSCFGMNDGSATVSATGGTAPYTYQWNPTGGTSDVATNLPGGDYQVLVNDANGCLGFTYITITEPNEIIINSTVVDEDCGATNGGIFAFASGGAGGLTYLWSGGQTSTSIVNIPNGNYSLTVTDFDGCTATENYVVSVIYDPNNPNNPDITISPDTLIALFAGDTEQIVASGGVTYSWSPSAGLSCDDCPNPIVTASTETYYTVTAYNANNCWDTSYVHVVIKVPCADMFLPTSFSPNGDGLNDELRVLGSCITSYEYTVYDRWGKKIFFMDHTGDTPSSWNGKINGVPVMIGSYPYTFKANFYDDTEAEYDYEEKGILKVIR